MAACVLFLALPSCKSDPAATTDLDAASDAPWQPEVPSQDATTSLPADAAAVKVSGKDGASDLAPPAMDMNAMDTSVDLPGRDTLSDASCSGWSALKRLSPAEAADLLATSDPIVINVHIPYAGDIPGTDTSIPYNQVDAIETYLKHDPCADVLLVCLSGGMSQTAGNELVKRGYLRVRDLSGGMQAWQSAGYPLLKDGGT